MACFLKNITVSHRPGIRRGIPALPFYHFACIAPKPAPEAYPEELVTLGDHLRSKATRSGIAPEKIRRRARAVGTFPDGQSAVMPVAARLLHVSSTKWGTRLYLNMNRLPEETRAIPIYLHGPWSMPDLSLAVPYQKPKVRKTLDTTFKRSLNGDLVLCHLSFHPGLRH